MTMTSFPHGYGSQLLTLDALRDRHAARMHPEYARRLFAALAAANGLVGIGSGWRSTADQAANYARDPKGFAPPGSSFHESHTFASGVIGYQAVDTVGRNGAHEAAWKWLRDNGPRFGLVTFHDVNGEPWHVQCDDIPLSVSAWKAAGRPDPAHLALPGDPPISAPENVTPTPIEEDDMKDLCYLWRHPKYANVWLVSPGGATHMTPALMDRYRAQGVPGPIIEDHDQALRSFMAQSGTASSDLVKA